MAVKITGVNPRSPAGKLNIKAGWELLEINGHAIEDLLDYRFYATDKSLELSLSDETGAVFRKTLQKSEYDELGLEFATYLMSPQKSCRNKCVFCFIDQLPPNLREPLYFKDDPVNVSVHTTSPALRAAMMKNPNAGESLKWLSKLTDAGIKVNAQLVLCPGINDGAELEKSLRELSGLAPNLQSVSAVPVGLTKFRSDLPELRLFTPQEAAGVLAAVKRFADANLEKHGSRICFAADELYLLAGTPIPGYEEYEDFFQLENGVGLMALLRHEFALALEAETPRAVDRRVTIATGNLAAPEIKRLAALAEERFPGLAVNVVPVANKFFGETITVAGLVTARDLIDTLKRHGHGPEILFPAVMLRRERDIFLDGPTPEEVGLELGAKMAPVENDGFEFLAALLGE